MYCQKCGKEIDDEAAFCIYCGKPTADVDASHHEISDENETKNEKSLNNIKKMGIAVIIVLVVIVVRLAAGGTRDKETDTAASVTGEETAKASVLNDIMGDWRRYVNTGSDTYANTYERPYYLRVEAEGISAIANMREGKLIKYYMVGCDDITVQEENGIKYYIYSAEMHSDIVVKNGGPSRQQIKIRLSLDEETGELICEVNAPEDGFWQKVNSYEPISTSIEEVIASF